MAIFCPDHQQARVVIVAEGVEKYRRVHQAPVRFEVVEIPNPWSSRVIWSWGDRYRNVRTGWSMPCPISIGIEIFQNRRYLYAIHAGGGYLSGQWLAENPAGIWPNAPMNYLASPIIVGYETPPPSVRYRGDFYDSGFIGSFFSSSAPPEAIVTCSCRLDEIQCGDILPEEDPPDSEQFCCINCETIAFSLRLKTKQLESIRGLL